MTTLAILAVVLLLIWYYRLKPRRRMDWKRRERLTNAVAAAHCQYQKEQEL